VAAGGSKRKTTGKRHESTGASNKKVTVEDKVERDKPDFPLDTANVD